MLSYFQKGSSELLRGVERKKYRSKQSIIKYLFLHGESTCNDIAQNIRLSSPSVQASINEMIKDGVIEEQGQGNSTGGRRPNIYGLRRESFFLLCLDVGRYHTRMAIVDSNRKLLNGITQHEIKFRDDNAYLDQLCEYADSLIQTSGIDESKLVGIGLDMPGVIDSRKGINYSYLYNPEVTLAERLEKRFNHPVFLENDANVIALAEYWYGKARGKKDAMVLLISWGIGLGLIINGKLYPGSSGYAGEFSHIPAKDNGKLCWCNKQGCLETVASATALSALVREGINSGHESAIFEQIDTEKEFVDPGIIINAANQGDQLAVQALFEVGFELGKGIAVLIQILNPEVIVLGGRMAKAGQYITTPIKHALNSYCNPLMVKDLKIETSSFKEEAAVLGSSIVVADRLLSNNV